MAYLLVLQRAVYTETREHRNVEEIAINRYRPLGVFFLKIDT